MANFVKENIGGNVLVVNEEIAKMVENIGIHETMKEMDNANLAHLATVLFVYKIRNGKKYHDELVKDIVVFALTKSKYNNMFNIVEEDLVCYDLSTNKRTEIVAKDLVDIFINNAEMRKQLLWLIKDEYSSIATNKNK